MLKRLLAVAPALLVLAQGLSVGPKYDRYVLPAFDGYVYDVTDCPKWRTGMHEQLHFAGQDLTSELPEAPHEADVFDRPCVRRVGPLVD